MQAKARAIVPLDGAYLSWMVHIVVQILVPGDEIVVLKAEAGRGWLGLAITSLVHQACAISTTLMVG